MSRKELSQASQQGPGDTAGSQAVAKKILMTYIYVFIWIALSSAVILLNKYILSFTSMHYPIFLTLSHMAFCSVLASALIFFRVTEPITMDLTTYFQTCVPIAGLFAGTLWLGNAAYLYLSVAFIQMVKAMMPCCVFMVGCLLGTEHYGHTYMMNMALVTVGIVIASHGELNFDLIGVVLQGSSLVTESFRVVLIQILLQSRGIKMNPIHTLYYIAPACFMFLCVPFVTKELPLMMSDDRLVIQPWLVLASAAAAFALNVSVFLLIGKSSALTMNVAGVVKDWLLIAFSVVLFKSPVTLQQYLGYGLSFLGVSWYNYIKLQSMRQEATTQPSTSLEDKTKAKDSEKIPLLVIQQDLAAEANGRRSKGGLGQTLAPNSVVGSNGAHR